mmetsp:Transcript_10637/g.15567  ORF Transcript_10637/g.15567 Transcript_10637/m.15567 type:complete len:94 (+) Transcript_10637:94-375(+)
MTKRMTRAAEWHLFAPARCLVPLRSRCIFRRRMLRKTCSCAEVTLCDFLQQKIMIGTVTDYPKDDKSGLQCLWRKCRKKLEDVEDVVKQFPLA